MSVSIPSVSVSPSVSATPPPPGSSDLPDPLRRVLPACSTLRDLLQLLVAPSPPVDALAGLLTTECVAALLELARGSPDARPLLLKAIWLLFSRGVSAKYPKPMVLYDHLEDSGRLPSSFRKIASSFFNWEGSLHSALMDALLAILTGDIDKADRLDSEVEAKELLKSKIANYYALDAFLLGLEKVSAECCQTYLKCLAFILSADKFALLNVMTKRKDVLQLSLVRIAAAHPIPDDFFEDEFNTESLKFKEGQIPEANIFLLVIHIFANLIFNLMRGDSFPEFHAVTRKLLGFFDLLPSSDHLPEKIIRTVFQSLTNHVISDLSNWIPTPQHCSWDSLREFLNYVNYFILFKKLFPVKVDDFDFTTNSVGSPGHMALCQRVVDLLNKLNFEMFDPTMMPSVSKEQAVFLKERWELLYSDRIYFTKLLRVLRVFPSRSDKTAFLKTLCGRLFDGSISVGDSAESDLSRDQFIGLASRFLAPFLQEAELRAAQKMNMVKVFPVHSEDGAEATLVIESFFDHPTIEALVDSTSPSKSRSTDKVLFRGSTSGSLLVGSSTPTRKHAYKDCRCGIVYVKSKELTEDRIYPQNIKLMYCIKPSKAPDDMKSEVKKSRPTRVIIEMDDKFMRIFEFDSDPDLDRFAKELSMLFPKIGIARVEGASVNPSKAENCGLCEASFSTRKKHICFVCRSAVCPDCCRMTRMIGGKRVCLPCKKLRRHSKRSSFAEEGLKTLGETSSLDATL